MAVNAPGMHQVLADGSPTCSVPTYRSSRPARSRPRPRDRSPGRPGRAAPLSPTVRCVPAPGRGYPAAWRLPQAQREA